LDLMVEEAAVSLKELRVDGGPTRDDFLMQFQSDMIATPVVRNKIEEISAAGVAYMAGLYIGIWENKKKLESLREVDRRFDSRMDMETRNRNYSGWKTAVGRALYKG
jgi:glycerol kinase